MDKLSAREDTIENTLSRMEFIHFKLVLIASFQISPK